MPQLLNETREAFTDIQTKHTATKVVLKVRCRQRLLDVRLNKEINSRISPARLRKPIIVEPDV